jgi:hypothetical protein
MAKIHTWSMDSDFEVKLAPYIDNWRKKKVNVSLLINQLLLDHAVKEGQVTIDAHIKKEQKKDDQNRKLDEFKILVDGYNANPHKLVQEYDLDQLKRLNSQTSILGYKIKEAIEIKRKQEEKERRERYARVSHQSREALVPSPSPPPPPPAALVAAAKAAKEQQEEKERKIENDIASQS